jgi:hypothetical protein
MHNIILICTVHDEAGLCNHRELYEILKKIKPEIIFEEIPPSAFDIYYRNFYRNNLETDVINAYLENYQIKHIPVDYDCVLPDSFWRDNCNMFKRVESNSYEYCKLMDLYSVYKRQYGFKYLNSDNNNIINDQIYNAIEISLKEINNEKLYQIYNFWKNINNKRENKMINTIYEYSKNHEYQKGVFFIGAAHRKSIIIIIQKYIEKENFEIDWNYNNYDNIL